MCVRRAQFLNKTRRDFIWLLKGEMSNSKKKRKVKCHFLANKKTYAVAFPGGGFQKGIG